ncbi:uncharacterized protein BO88DRAFT_408060 [Aspergillus vadensis CBS 113365]|uniref:Invertebrate defensins family profile domain-containing protein n=1 Tax=Aspergillus vadensis (strain CBS 113365 / IMI 142717 / IBT 24658) TaxID=1448311 RepID=A0A319AZ88_ASPVC|nr:hypothetical protein BO88DRAFT_408060 [Aspergillus vadensis CBS 113365]PYH64731.1 hypothetical protein BO88DRAFT_408060 [Aspergillus vadensis CBS 113365]
MKAALVTLYSCLGLGVPALAALMEIMLSNSTSCQIRGGDDIANLACRNTCIEQGGGWTGGFCDDQQICHCTFDISTTK